ncbi:uncharacterized protein L203_103260 [Cryptococcus depauperatus CBS 7841]|uniref:Uncharacterized protein n=1 Tax=Cryptococcus depauperatus CBS 7841 TaxID=1295531 RepID=A0AAJ8JTF2_9TREE
MQHLPNTLRNSADLRLRLHHRLYTIRKEYPGRYARGRRPFLWVFLSWVVRERLSLFVDGASCVPSTNSFNAVFLTYSTSSRRFHSGDTCWVVGTTPVGTTNEKAANSRIISWTDVFPFKKWRLITLASTSVVLSAIPCGSTEDLVGERDGVPSSGWRSFSSSLFN